MTKDDALKLALDALETELSIDWGNPDDFDTSVEKMHKAITAIKEALAQPEQEQEPVAWRTFDGEGGYDYCSYEDNESYADDWDKRNPNHKGWVDKLYTHSQRTWVGLTDEEVKHIEETTTCLGNESWLRNLTQAIEAKLKEKNT